jgi:DNA-nicking Smr family endonuclease
MDADKKLFDEAMKGVKPLRTSNKITPKKKQTTARTHSHQKPNRPEPVHTALSDPWDISHIQAETCLNYGKTRVQPKQFKALKQGQIRPEARLDLHGFHVEEAGITLTQFIQHTHAQKMRCVLVIHGKGGRFHEPPILKAHVNHWLKQLPQVLAFHSAKPRDGGFGAVYILMPTGSGSGAYSDSDV